MKWIKLMKCFWNVRYDYKTITKQTIDTNLDVVQSIPFQNRTIWIPEFNLSGIHHEFSIQVSSNNIIAVHKIPFLTPSVSQIIRSP